MPVFLVYLGTVEDSDGDEEYLEWEGEGLTVPVFLGECFKLVHSFSGKRSFVKLYKMFVSLVLNRSPIIFKNLQIKSKSVKDGLNRRIFSC